MLCYMLSHEAHHRGQVCMLAHQLGFPLPNEVAYGIWNWEKLWKECGSPGGPLRNRSRAQAPGDGLRWWRHRAPAVGIVVEAPGGGGQKQAPGSHVWKGAAGTWP